MQQSSGTFSTTKCDIENTCVIHQKREIEIMMEWGINIKSQREWGKCLDKALSLVPRFACAPQDNSYRPPCQKSPVPSANTFLFRGFRVRHGPRPILRRALGFLQNSLSLSTSGAYGTGFIDEPFTKGQICMNYEQHGRSNPQTVLIISSMRNAAWSKHTRCNQMVFPSHVFVEICLPKRGRGDAALVFSGLAGVHFWLWGQGANGGRERDRGEEHEGEWDEEGCCEPFCWNVQRWREAICCITTTCRRERGEGGSVAPQVMISPRLGWNKCTRYSATVTSICY